MKKIATVQVVLCGIAPLLMHNSQLADPMNTWTRDMKKISSKRNKTDDDMLMLREYEWNGGMYFDELIGPYIPAEVIEAAIAAGAAKSKKKKAVTVSVGIEADRISLEYEGPRSRSALYEKPDFVDVRPVKVNKGSTVMRTRPKFMHPWRLRFNLMIRVDIMNVADVLRALEVAGSDCAIGDYRPKYGRFMVEKFEEV